MNKEQKEKLNNDKFFYEKIIIEAAENSVKSTK